MYAKGNLHSQLLDKEHRSTGVLGLKTNFQNILIKDKNDSPLKSCSFFDFGDLTDKIWAFYFAQPYV